jgi:hypothetical protein
MHDNLCLRGPSIKHFDTILYTSFSFIILNSYNLCICDFFFAEFESVIIAW